MLIVNQTRHSLDIWKPTVSTAWQSQLDGLLLNLDIPAGICDLDAFETEVEIIEQLHGLGRKVIYYISAGSWEEWRPDAGEFGPETIGEEYRGWLGERWLDIQQRAKLEPIMRKRLEVCREKGFDAVESDNIGDRLEKRPEAGRRFVTVFRLCQQRRLLCRWLVPADVAVYSGWKNRAGCGI